MAKKGEGEGEGEFEREASDLTIALCTRIRLLHPLPPHFTPVTQASDYSARERFPSDDREPLYAAAQFFDKPPTTSRNEQIKKYIFQVITFCVFLGLGTPTEMFTLFYWDKNITFTSF